MINFTPEQFKRKTKKKFSLTRNMLSNFLRSHASDKATWLRSQKGVFPTDTAR